MLARAAVEDSLWPHLLAIGWQALWVVLFDPRRRVAVPPQGDEIGPAAGQTPPARPPGRPRGCMKCIGGAIGRQELFEQCHVEVKAMTDQLQTRRTLLAWLGAGAAASALAACGTPASAASLQGQPDRCASGAKS